MARGILAFGASCWLGLTPVASAADGAVAALAPSWPEVQEAAAQLEARLAESDAALRALARVHNAVGARLAEGAASCADDALMGAVARTPALGALARARGQAARAQAARVATGRAAPTVAPLVVGEAAARLDALEARAAAIAGVYAGLAAYEERFLAPLRARCRPALAPAPGLPDPTPIAPDEARKPVAVVALGPGVVCPAGLPAVGEAVLVRGAACVAADAACGCTPVPVSPGAVLGPATAAGGGAGAPR